MAAKSSLRPKAAVPPSDEVSDHALPETQSSRVARLVTSPRRKKARPLAGVEPSPDLPPDETSDQRDPDTHEDRVARLVFLSRVRTRLLSLRIAVQNAIDANDRLRTGETKGRGQTKRIPTLDDIAVADAVMGGVPIVEPTDKALKDTEKTIRALARELPIWPFAESIRGFGELGLGLIIGASGDLSNYANPGKLWKRMGLALVDGERQRRCADAEKALAHGYNPRRRSMMFTIGDALIKQNGRGGDWYYRRVYDARKAYEIARAPEMTPMQAHRRAQRYMEKRLLRHLWQVWKRSTVMPVEPSEALSTMLDAEASELVIPNGPVPQHPTIM